MATKLSVLCTTVVLALGFGVKMSSAQYWETYEVYPQYVQQTFTQQPAYYPHQVYPTYNQVAQHSQFQQSQIQQSQVQQNPTVSVVEAEWVCTNTKTRDQMIIAPDNTPGPRANGPEKWQQQAYYPNVQEPPADTKPVYPQVQPTYPQNQPPSDNGLPPNQVTPNPPTTTTTESLGPIWSDGEGNGNRPTRRPEPTYPAITNRPIGPIWSDNGGNGRPQVNPTTQRPTVNPIWPVGGGSGNQPGFTVDEPTRKPQQTTTTTTTTTQGPPDDDYGPIDIVLGKK